MKTLLHYFRKYWFLAALASIFMVGEVSIDLLQPRLMETIIDQGILGIGNGGVSDLDLVISTGIRMIIIVLAGGACGVLSGVFSNLCGQNYGNALRKAAFRRIMHFSFEQTDDFSTGSLITRITNDVTQVQTLVMQMVRGFVRCLMFFVGGTAALLSMDLSFGVILAITFPLIILHIAFVVWKTNPLFLLLQNSLDRLNAVMQENVAGVRVVKAFVQEEAEEARFAKANQDLVNTQFRVLLLLSYLRPVMNIVLNAAVVGILYLGAIHVQEGSMAPGTVMAAITYISQILNGMMMLAMIFQTLSRGLVSARRVREVIEAEPAIKGGGFEGKKAEGQGGIRFRDVSFRYPGGGSDVLRHVDLTIAPGETLAVIGATGSGKSTLVDLIPRFYDVTAGSIELNGRDIREYDLTALREKITVCLQKSELFSTTIKDNIRIGRPSATEEEIRQAAEDAQALDFILRQPEGFDTAVAERGMSLSGGQRQRIAIARALLKDSDVLIFDDSTSALDLRTEAALYKALRERYAHRTKIIIAQRIASVRNADRIAVLDQGRIAACGTHKELMEKSAIYRDIYESQLKDAPKEGGAA